MNSRRTRRASSVTVIVTSCCNAFAADRGLDKRGSAALAGAGTGAVATEEAAADFVSERWLKDEGSALPATRARLEEVCREQFLAALQF